MGTPGSVQSITRDDAVAFYKRIMVPGNAVIVVVGRRPPGRDHRGAGSPIADLVARARSPRLRRSRLRLLRRGTVST